MAAPLFDIRRGEGPRVARAGGALFAILAGFTIAETARDSLFLGSNGANGLAVAYLLLAGIAVLALFGNAWLVRKLGRKNALIVTLLAAAAGTAVFFTLARGPGAGLALYMWTGLIGTVVVVQFWLLASTRFTSAEAKRLYGPIAASGALGTLGGAIAAWTLLHTFEIEALLLVAAGFYVIAALLLARDRHSVEPRLGARAIVRAPRRQRRQSYVTRLALLTICTTAVALLADWLFKSTASHAFHTEALARFIARFNGTVAALSLVFQLFGAAWLVRKVGVLGMAVLLPALMLLGGTSAALTFGSFYAVCLTKGADASLRYSVNRVATELLWMPVPDALRTSVREPLESVVTRLVQAITAALLLGLVELGLARPAVVAWILAGIALVWTLTAGGLRNRYLGQLRQSLSRRSLEPEHELDASAITAVVDALSSDDDRRVIAAIQILEARRKSELIPALILRHDSVAVQTAALGAVSVRGRPDWIAATRRLLRSSEPRSRVLALRVLARIDDETAIIAGLCDADPGVMAHGVFWSLQTSAAEIRDNAALVGLLGETGPRGDTAAAELLDAIRTDGDARWGDVLLELTITRGFGDTLIDGLALAIERVPDPRLIPFLIDRLGSRAGRPAVRRALLAIGEPASSALEAALIAATTIKRVRLHIPKSLAEFANKRAADVLVAQLSRETSGAVRYRVLRALAKMAVRDEVIVDEVVLLQELRNHLAEHSRLLALSIPILADEDPAESAVLLRGLLADKTEQALDRAFLALQALHPREQMREISRALATTDDRARAHASEFLDTITRTVIYSRQEAAGLRAQIMVLGEDLDPRERLKRSGAVVEIPETVPQAVAALIREHDALLAACAGYYSLALETPGLVDVVDEVAADRPLFEPLGIFHARRHAG